MQLRTEWKNGWAAIIALIFGSLSQGLSREQKNKQALLTAVYVFIIMTLTYYISASATIKHSTTFPSWVLLTAPPLIFLSTSIILWCCLRASDLIMKATESQGLIPYHA
ncbi:hypothetical protein [Pseudomonas sp. EL_65y_Pfl2_R96]|uniref:hypothetical protein n=1 Tax=Pseudomonas sp. EL_65y_Pfl2_R96 TaxID=3088699 RepID=UPI0030D8B8F6